MSNFAEAMKNMIDDIYNVSITENGAVGYKTTNQPLLDMNFKVSSYRSKDEDEIINDFRAAFSIDPVLAMQWLFYIRDCREGVGERRLFRVIIKWLAKNCPSVVFAVIPFIPFYGRFDDLLELIEDVPPIIKEEVLSLIKEQLADDIDNYLAGKPFSLLAKWLPSPNASSKETKHKAIIIRKYLGLSEKKYRKILTSLRKKLNVVEVKMSANEWDKIDYETVPSKANLIYGPAFIRNDEERRVKYLEQVLSGKKEIHSSVLFPHKIVSKYRNYCVENDTLEALWKSLPNLVDKNSNTIVVADGSGSMRSRVDPKSKTCALDVADALAIYFAERASGQFKDKYITFSENPQLVDLSKGKSLKDKLDIAEEYSEIANTNIEAVFDLILNTAIENNMPQSELPQNILIISDMEFDRCAYYNKPFRNAYGQERYLVERPSKKLFEVISERYKNAGYKMPRLIFWNVASRTNTIPLKENELGVALISGFSTNLVKMVMSEKNDPYECLLETLNSPRYLLIKREINDLF